MISWNLCERPEYMQVPPIGSALTPCVRRAVFAPWGGEDAGKGVWGCFGLPKSDEKSGDPGEGGRESASAGEKKYSRILRDPSWQAGVCTIDFQ